MTKPALLRSAFAAAPLVALLLALLPSAPDAQAKKTPPDHWVGTWATANYARDNRPAADGAAVMNAADTTYREVLRTTLAGDLVRVELSNEFGTEPLTIGAVHVALSDEAKGHPADIDLISANALTFNNSGSVTIAPGATAISDPFALKLPAGADLAVSLFVPAQTISTLTWHGSALTTNFIAPGNVVRKVSMADPALHAQTTGSWFFLKSVDVKTAPETTAIVAFGDSITDGARSSVDGHAAWPSVLAARLAADPATQGVAVLNEGIGGNRILHDGTGPSALARFDRDVLAEPGVSAVILMEGINDIGHATDPVRPFDVVSADDLIQGLSQLAARAHAKNLKVYGATLTPFVGAKYQSPAGEQMRKTVNNWIRTTPQLDGVFDFAKVTDDPAHPDTMLPAYDSGDHLHPSDAGYKAMADSINLTLFATPGRKTKNLQKRN